MTELYSMREIVDAAIAKEHLRQGYYAAVAKLAEQTPMRELFSFLADEEQRHVAVFTEMRARIPEQERPPGFDEEMQGYLRVLLEDRLSQQEDPLELARATVTANQVFRTALGFEKDSILYFSEFMDYVSPEDKRILKQLIAEERSHIKKLAALRRELNKR